MASMAATTFALGILCLGFRLARADIFNGPRIFLEKDQNISPHKDWLLVGRAPNNSETKLVFALKHSNVDALERALNAVSTPGSPLYGEFMSLESLSKMIMPSIDAQTVIITWLQASGVRVDDACHWTFAHEFLSCKVTCALASGLLDVDLSLFRHRHHRHISVIRAAGHYSLPDNVAAHVDFVGGLHRFPDLRGLDRTYNARRAQLNRTQPALAATPTTLRTMYKVRCWRS